MARVIGRYGTKVNPRQPDPEPPPPPKPVSMERTWRIGGVDIAESDLSEAERRIMRAFGETVFDGLARAVENVGRSAAAAIERAVIAGDSPTARQRSTSEFFGLGTPTPPLVYEFPNEPEEERRGRRDARPDRITSVRQARGRRNDIPNPNRWGRGNY